MTYPFDTLDRLKKTASLLWVYQSMEIELEDFKKRNPESTKVKDTEEKINTLRELYAWLQLRYREFEVIQYSNIELMRLNANMAAEIKTLQKENEKFIKMLNEN